MVMRWILQVAPAQRRPRRCFIALAGVSAAALLSRLLAWVSHISHSPMARVTMHCMLIVCCLICYINQE